MATVAYTANPGAPLYTAPTMRLYRAGPYGSNEVPLTDWKPKSLHWRHNGQLSTMQIEYILGQGVGKARVRPEAVTMTAGDRIRLVDTATGLEWFRGNAGQMDMLVQSEKDIESVMWTVYGPEQMLSHRAVQGQWCKSEFIDDLEIAAPILPTEAVRSNAWQSNLPCVFNRYGKPNASSISWKLDSDALRYAPAAGLNAAYIFEPTDRDNTNTAGIQRIKAVHWNPLMALTSLIEWVDRYNTIHYDAADIANWWAVISLTPDMPEVDVHGKTLLEAIAAVLGSVGVGWALTPWAVAGTNEHKLLVFSLDRPSASKRPNLAALAAGANVGVTSAAGQAAVVQRLDFSRDSHNVANNILVLGDNYRLQKDLDFGPGSFATWDLKPYWDTTAYAITRWYNTSGRFALSLSGATPATGAAPTVGGDVFADRHDTTGEKFNSYREVYRSFGWNEDGGGNEFGWGFPDLVAESVADLSANQGLRRPRPMQKTLTYNGKQKLIPAVVSIAVATPDSLILAKTWMPLKTIQWTDRCGFTIQQSSLGNNGKLVAGWRPWAASGYENETLAITTATQETYRDLVYMELLHNTITNADDTYKLVMRMSGTVEGDTVVRGLGAAPVASRWPFFAQRVSKVGNRFQFKRRLDVHVWGANAEDVADDRADAQLHADGLASTAGAEMGHGSILLRHLSREYSIGDGIPETAGRRIDFSLDAGGQRKPIVVGITWTFGDMANKTELVMDSPLLGIT